MTGTIVTGRKFEAVDASARLWSGVTSAIFQLDGTVSVTKLVLIIRSKACPMT